MIFMISKIWCVTMCSKELNMTREGNTHQVPNQSFQYPIIPGSTIFSNTRTRPDPKLKTRQPLFAEHPTIHERALLQKDWMLGGLYLFHVYVQKCYKWQKVECLQCNVSVFLTGELSPAGNICWLHFFIFSIIGISILNFESTCRTTPFPAIMSHLLISALSAYRWPLAVLRTCNGHHFCWDLLFLVGALNPIQPILILPLTETCPAPALLRDLLKKTLFFAMPEQQRTCQEQFGEEEKLRKLKSFSWGENLVQDVPLHNFLCKSLIRQQTTIHVLRQLVKGGVRRDEHRLPVLLRLLPHLDNIAISLCQYDCRDENYNVTTRPPPPHTHTPTHLLWHKYSSTHLVRHAGKLEQLQEPGELLLAFDQSEDGGWVGKQNPVKGEHCTCNKQWRILSCWRLKPTSANWLLAPDEVCTLGSSHQVLPAAAKETALQLELVHPQILLSHLNIIC